MEIPNTSSSRNEAGGRVWRFGDCEFNELRRELRVNGQKVELEHKPLAVLEQLLIHAGETVTKEQLLESVWPGTTVVDGSLATAISKLRKCLEEGSEPIIITVPRVGYRLAVSVQSSRVTMPAWPGPRSINTAPGKKELDATAGVGAHKARRISVALGMLVVLAIGAALYYRKPSALPSPSRTVAVLPFQNAGADQSLEFLRVALPDEITTILSYKPSVSVRPFASTSKYSQGNLDLQKIGRDLRVANIVTGHFLRSGDKLQITLEAIDADSNRLMWRETVETPAQNLIAMQAQIAGATQSWVARVFGSNSPDLVGAAKPKNEEAYDLYLRSTAVPNDPAPNKEATAMLEKAIALDPTYVPAYIAISTRYYYQSRYGDGGPAMMRRSRAAMDRALALDPNNEFAAEQVIVAEIESGESIKAYQQSEDLVRRRPDSVMARWALGAVLRYTGLLDEATSNCEAAYLIDASPAIRSCAVSFILHGDYERAMVYIRLVQGSEWAKALTTDVLARQGKEQEALSLSPATVPQWAGYPLFMACVQHRPAAEIANLARQVVPVEDSEENYFAAAHLAYCGQTAAAEKMLRTAIAGNYCAFPAIESDPLLASVRQMPDYPDLRNTAKACRDRFLSLRAQDPR